jgi:hypothetical protein
LVHLVHAGHAANDPSVGLRVSPFPPRSSGTGSRRPIQATRGSSPCVDFASTRFVATSTLGPLLCVSMTLSVPVSGTGARPADEVRRGHVPHVEREARSVECRALRTEHDCRMSLDTRSLFRLPRRTTRAVVVPPRRRAYLRGHPTDIWAESEGEANTGE